MIVSEQIAELLHRYAELCRLFHRNPISSRKTLARPCVRS
jgi:hypothetical protein